MGRPGYEARSCNYNYTHACIGLYMHDCVCSRIVYTSHARKCYSLDFMLPISVLSLLVFVHDDNGHNKEANVSQEDQYHWSNDGPDE